MPARHYGQACSVARFLDQLGSRWTLLIVRDLLVGPRRFKDLLANSPSMGPNLLTDRLRELQELGVIEKAALPEDSRTSYVLTDKGMALEPVVLAMARWGFTYPQVDPSDPGTSRPDLLVVAFRAAFVPDRAVGIDESYEFHVDDVIFHADIKDGELLTALGSASHPSFVLTTDSNTFDEYASGALDISDAIKNKLMGLSGSRRAFDRFQYLFGAR